MRDEQNCASDTSNYISVLVLDVYVCTVTHLSETDWSVVTVVVVSGAAIQEMPSTLNSTLSSTMSAYLKKETCPPIMQTQTVSEQDSSKA